MGESKKQSFLDLQIPNLSENDSSNLNNNSAN